VLSEGLVELFWFGGEGVGKGAKLFDSAVNSVAFFEKVPGSDGDACRCAGCDYVAGLECHQVT